MTHAFDDSPAVDLARAETTAAPPEPAWRPVVITGSAPDPTPVRRRLSGLDGLRAVAVLAVVAFHLDFSLAPGGFLGVDVFFVISGLLITNMVAREILETGGLRLRRFYSRRARRLLPTVLVMLAVVSLASVTLWRDQLTTLGGGGLSSLFYVTNWWLIADKQPYFESTGRPPMVQHLWSLAIEEQFYIVWTLVVLALVVVAAERINPVARVRLVAVVALVLAVASTLTMTVLAIRSGLPYFGSTSRVYFGSDTHSMGLFLGSACGAWLAVRQRDAPARPPRLPGKFVWLTDVVGGVLLVVLVVQFFTVTEFSPGLYRGGFLLFGALVLAVVLCALRRRSLLGRVLDMRPIRWVGQRSYSIYIWHFPVAVVTRPDLDVRGPTILINVCRFVLILGLAALSHHFIEVPLRSGQWRRWRHSRQDGARRRWDVAAVLTTLVAALCLGASASAVGSPDAPKFFLHPQRSSAPSFVAVAPEPSPPRPGAPSVRPHPTPTPTHSAVVPPVATPIDLSAFGDSVLLGAQQELRGIARHYDVDAVEGRQPYEVLDDVLARAQDGDLKPDVVIHTGNNGIISPDQLRATLTALHSAHRVVLLTDRVSREWQDPNNTTIADVGKDFDNVVVLDWYERSANQSGWLYSDGLHLTPAGARAYARLIKAALTARR